MAAVSHYSGFEGFFSTLHKIAATTTVYVHIDSSRKYIPTPCIDTQVYVVQNTAMAVDFGYLIVLHHNRAAVYPLAAWYQDFAVKNLCYHIFYGV